MKEALFWLCGFGEMLFKAFWEDGGMGDAYVGSSGWLLSGVMSLCMGVKTVVGWFVVAVAVLCGVSVCRGSALGPLLFVIVVKALSGEFGVALPSGLLCSGDLFVVVEAGND